MSILRRRPGVLLAVVGPGLLVAATGVGAGDLATAGFAGSRLGPAILWAVVLGAFLKFVVNEGLARWQLATGETILHGAMTRLGPVVQIGFLVYLLPWSFFTGAALISACGVTAHAMLPWIDDPVTARLVWGGMHSAVGVGLALAGGFKVFERIMAACIAVMFIAVVLTAVLARPDLGAVATGLVVPRIPQFDTGGLTWTIALSGGVGGTLTVLCYGYWIRAEQRTDLASLRTCRIDLGVGYVFTALFGIAMVIVATGLSLDGKGAGLIVGLASQLESSLGAGGRWLFLIGAWTAVFSSLLGVWQAVPLIFADYCRTLADHRRGPDSTTRTSRPALERTWAARAYMLALATIPLLAVRYDFRDVAKYYAVLGAFFVPLLAAVLLIMNGHPRWMPRAHRNRPLTVAVLVFAVLVFGLAGIYQIRARWG